jgi:hypothetical protein
MTRLKITLLILFLTLLSNNLSAQRLQFGLGGNLHTTFPHQKDANYGNPYFKGQTEPGFGFSIPISYAFDTSWTFTTGVGFQRKFFRYEINGFGPNIQGQFYVRPGINSYELPLILAFAPSRKAAENKLNLKLGCVLTLNSETSFMTSFWAQSNDTIQYDISPISTKPHTFFSPDIYIGISLVKFAMREGESAEQIPTNQKQHEISLSYQYGFGKSNQVDFDVNLSTRSENLTYRADFAPRLSMLALTYTVYLNTSRLRGFPNQNW